MISRRISLALVATAALVSTAFQPCVAQTTQTLNPQSAAPLAASASTAVPALVPFSGAHNRAGRQARLRRDRHTFLIFKDQDRRRAALCRNPGHNPGRQRSLQSPARRDPRQRPSRGSLRHRRSPLARGPGRRTTAPAPRVDGQRSLRPQGRRLGDPRGTAGLGLRAGRQQSRRQPRHSRVSRSDDRLHRHHHRRRLRLLARILRRVDHRRLAVL